MNKVDVNRNFYIENMGVTTTKPSRKKKRKSNKKEKYANQLRAIEKQACDQKNQDIIALECGVVGAGLKGDPCRKTKRKSNKKAKYEKRLLVIESQISEEDKSNIVALDCEMVGVGLEGMRSALARVCIINWSHEIILDTFVKVEEPVTDYRTFVSGIHSEDIQSRNALSPSEVREKVQSIIENKILVGHGLKCDLQAIGVMHPWYNQRDTAKFQPYMKPFGEDKIYRARKLRDLAEEKLGITIQSRDQAHCPIQDASTALDLYKISYRKWEKVMEWKVQKTICICSQ